VAILRPHGLDAKVLTYLLASPLGQLQFQRAESGASGQTGVGEDDLRRFRFPVLSKQEAQKLVEALDADLRKIKKAKRKLQRQERQVWSKFDQTITAKAKRRSK
jgi:restriction endonuclease S subunit